jgi:hypothetical protein
MKTEIDPMIMTVSAGGSVPNGNYTGKFQKAEYLPETEADPMTGKGGRQFAAIRFSWEITEGDYQGKIVNTETPTADGVKSRRYQVMSWLTGKNPSAGEAVSLATVVGKRYLLTLGSRNGKQWIEVTNAMLIPNQ